MDCRKALPQNDLKEASRRKRACWPDFRRENLYDSIREYQQRERRFGGLANE